MPPLTDDIVEAILPAQEPPVLLAEGVSERDFELALESRESRRDRQILRWTTLFQAVTERMRPDQTFTGFQYITYGFVPVTRDIAEWAGGAQPYVFGAAIELEPHVGVPDQQAFEFFYEDIRFPVVLNRRNIELDLPIITTRGHFGTPTCWARSNKSLTPLPNEGLLTAAHVVEGIPLGAAVNCSLGGPWLVAERGGCKIDVALIVQDRCLPPNVSILPVDRLPKQYSAISFMGAATAHPITGSITHSFVHPSTLSSHHPMRIFLDVYGQGGDSGALVENAADGAGVGVYMGRNPLKEPGHFEGVAQALCQGVYVLNTQLFRL